MSERLKALLFILSFGILCIPQESRSQINQKSIYDTINRDDLGNVSDQFQDLFFQAITQSAIENPEKAISILKKAKRLDTNQGVIYFELAKNYNALGDFEEAENNFLRALKERPDDQMIWSQLYKVYEQTKNYPKAIEVAKKLAVFNEAYKIDLAQLYLLNKQYKWALQSLDDIDSKKGRNEFRSALRRKIYRKTDDVNRFIHDLKQKIESEPDNIQNYTDLIDLYIQSHQLEKAYQTGLKLQNRNPDTVETQLAFYKYYLHQGEYSKAVKSMKLLLNNGEIDPELKMDIVKDFSALVKNHPEYEDDLVWVLGEEGSQGNQSNQQLGEYYIGKNNIKAISYFEKALKETPGNFKLIKETLILQNKEKQFAEALKISSEALDIFPSQPFLYLMRGTSQNGLGNYSAAKENLENGLSFVVDNTTLKFKFYKELVKVYKEMGNTKKAMIFQEKANQLKTK